MIRQMAILMILFALGFVSSQQKYPLKWGIKKGLYNVYKRNISIETTSYRIVEGQKKIRSPKEKVNIVSFVHWKVKKAYKNSRYLIESIIKDGKIRLYKAGQKHILYTHSPDLERKIKQPIFTPYRRLLEEAVAFLLNIKKKQVLITWILKKQNGKYKKTMYRGKKDPLGIEYSFKQLPDRSVAIGYKWAVARPQQEFIYEYIYTFAKIIRFHGREVAKIKVYANIISGKQKVGQVHGYILHDYRKHILVYQELTESKKVEFAIWQKKGSIRFVQDSKTRFKTELKKSKIEDN